MGADLVIDHTADVIQQLSPAGIEQVDMVLSTAGTTDNLACIGAVLRPFGHLSAVDLGGPLDIGPLVRKSVSLHTEMVFSQIISGADLSSQHRIFRASPCRA